MNCNQLMTAANISAELAARWIGPLSAAMSEFGILKVTDQAMFIAQAGHESSGFSRLVENLNYSPEGLLKVFPKYFNAEKAEKYGRTIKHSADQRAIANIVYGQRMGNTKPDDGWIYRARGLIGITFASNYRACGDALGLDLLLVPTLLEQDEYAARSAAWFFTSKGCLNYSGNVSRVTNIINSGNNGLKDRRVRYKKALAVLDGA
ncbi:glycoside hydrolase family 19 protein [Pantoea sp. B623]|uniref:glycoside hydrolase family 19 protein n=1 Tax=Pantoea TaxID=53335 RepID=UPI000E267CF2|nr:MULTISPECIES: glycoside hydrolase family 19 protein [Pantoea]MCS4493562.1 glycoside hydrolase family 19 protein [Pantoea sp. B623]REF11655.1 putative chitinase [Pantoea ananatis]